jgi:hypothetical protein
MRNSFEITKIRSQSKAQQSKAKQSKTSLFNSSCSGNRLMRSWSDPPPKSKIQDCFKYQASSSKAKHSTAQQSKAKHHFVAAAVLGIGLCAHGTTPHPKVRLEIRF